MTDPTSIHRSDLVTYLDTVLDIAASGDWCPNGLQVEGREQIARVVTGVSACQSLFDQAVAWDADAIVVHHGLYWDGAPVTLTGLLGRRVRTLIGAEINLLAYHLPLDRHLELGNNAVAGRQYGLRTIEPFGEAKGLPVGVHGALDQPMSLESLVARTRTIYDQDPLVFPGGPDSIRSLGIVSGGGTGEVYTAIDAGLDAFITGEPREWLMNLAREAGIHVLTAGHHATERLGPRALGERIAEHFGLDVRFIDVPNPA